MNVDECHFTWCPSRGSKDADPEKSIAHLTANVDGYPEENVAILLLGYLHTQLKKPEYSEAINIFNGIISKFQQSAVNHEEMGYRVVAERNKVHVLTLMERNDEAKELFNRLQEFNLSSCNKTQACIWAIHAFALSNYSRDYVNEAIHLTKMAMESDVDNPYWKMNYVYLIGKRRRDKENSLSERHEKEEEDLLNEAIRLTEGKDYKPILQLAKLLFYSGRERSSVNRKPDERLLDASIKLYEKALNLTPESVTVLTACGEAFHVIGKPGYKQKGLQYLRKAVEVERMTFGTLFKLGRALATYRNDAEKMQEAEDCLRDAVHVGRWRSLHAEIFLGRVRRWRNSSYDLVRHFEDRKKWYEGRDDCLERLNEEIEKIKQRKRRY